MRSRVAAMLIVSTAGLLGLARADTLDSLMHAMPADSLVVPLRRLENLATRPREGAEAALLLGQLLYARGEYRAAAGAFGRAAARLDPERKPEARYWTGLCDLALQESGAARAVLEEVAQSGSKRQLDAQFGVALAWEQAQKPDQAFAILTRLADSGHGEIMPAVLDRTLALAEVFQKTDVAARARRRLVLEYPNSIEAARAGLVSPLVHAVQPIVELGPFASEPRAFAVADQARRAGFPTATAVTRAAGSARVYLVSLGPYADETEAREAGQKAHGALGVPFRVTAPK